MTIKTLRVWNNSVHIARNNKAMWNKCTMIEKLWVFLGIANRVQGQNEYRIGVM